jgi:hypothetical protein
VKLFEIADQIENILADETMVSRETGEISEAAIEALTKLEMARDEKALAIARYCIGEVAEGKAVKAQADRLAKRAQAHANRADRLKRYIEAFLPEGTKLRDDVVNLYWSRSSSVFVPAAPELASWPEQFVRVTREADKSELAKALKAGELVPSGVCAKSTPYVVIK